MIRQLLVARADLFPVIDPKKDSPERFLLEVGQQLSRLLGGFSKQTVLGVPSADWQMSLTQTVPDPLPSPDQIVISVGLDDLVALGEFRKAVADANDQAVNRPPFHGVGADLSLAGSEYFCPANVDQILFGDRNAAAALTQSKMLQLNGLTGKNVNVVVIDEGFDRNLVRNFGGGLIYRPVMPPGIAAIQPGATKRGHGLMVVRNIFDVAPDATFYDVPLIPPRITSVNGFVANALGAFVQLLVTIAFLRRYPQWSGPWVLVNAWSIFDRSSEHPPGDYTQNPNHPLNLIIDAMVTGGSDFVFAAGNCGQFCPDRRCSEQDVGPGNSILGANSLRRVLTVGAVRTDARWMGSSSQGPGQMSDHQQKPDLCAPSFFRENDDASLGNLSRAFVGDTGTPYIASTGTSAACGVAAGIVAAIRSGWDTSRVSPYNLIATLNQGTLKTEGPNWNRQLGHGIINVESTWPLLPQPPMPAP